MMEVEIMELEVFGFIMEKMKNGELELVQERTGMMKEIKEVLNLK